MNAETVIEKGSHVFLQTLKEDAISTLPNILIGVFVFVFSLVLIHFFLAFLTSFKEKLPTEMEQTKLELEKIKKEDLPPFQFLKDKVIVFFKLTGAILILFFTYSFCSFFSSSSLSHEKDSKAYQTWKKEYVLPYLETLPLQEYEIVDITKSDLTKNTKDEIQGRVDVVYKKDGKLEVFHGYATIQYKKDATATLSYIDVPVDLGNGYRKGKQQFKVVLPLVETNNQNN